MEKYKNVRRVSGVRAYRIGSDFIEVMFNDCWVYTYTYRSAGAGTIEHMKILANQGYGLNTYIVKLVGKKYSKKSYSSAEIQL